MPAAKKYQVEDRRTGHVFGLYEGVFGALSAIQEMQADPGQAPAIQALRESSLQESEKRIAVELAHDPFQAREAIEELREHGRGRGTWAWDAFIEAHEVGSLVQRYHQRILFTVGQRMAGGDFSRDPEARADRFEGEVWLDGTGFQVWCTRPFGATLKECRLEAQVIDQRPSSMPVPSEPAAKTSRKAS